MNYPEKAFEVLTAIRAIGTAIPGYKSQVSAEEMRALVRHATVPPEFIEATAVAVEATPELTHTALLDPDDARDAQRFAVYCQTIAQELELVARGVRYAGLKRLATAGDAALRTLAVAKTLNRRTLIVPYVESMQKALRSRRKKAAKRVADPGQQPSDDPSND